MTNDLLVSLAFSQDVTPPSGLIRCTIQCQLRIHVGLDVPLLRTGAQQAVPHGSTLKLVGGSSSRALAGTPGQRARSSLCSRSKLLTFNTSMCGNRARPTACSSQAVYLFRGVSCQASRPSPQTQPPSRASLVEPLFTFAQKNCSLRLGASRMACGSFPPSFYHDFLQAFAVISITCADLPA